MGIEKIKRQRIMNYKTKTSFKKNNQFTTVVMDHVDKQPTKFHTI